MQIVLSDQTYSVDLPVITIDKFVAARGNATEVESDIIVDTITAFALFLTESAKHGKDVADIAKDGIKGIAEWAAILKLIPSIIPVLVQFYNGVIKNAEEFSKSILTITPEQKAKSAVAFMTHFDIANDKVELAIEKAISLILEVITLIKVFK